MKITEKEYYMKFVKHVVHLYNVAKKDEMICGDAYVEFTDRKIEVIDPTKVTLTIDKKRTKIKQKRGRGSAHKK